MRRLFLVALAVVVTPVAALSQNQGKAPATGDLGFLIGTWNITAVHHDLSDPKAPGRRETGSKACRYTLENGGEPSYIVCENNSIYKGADDEFPEAYIEYINYNPYVEAFEKTNFFSGFPVKVIERVTFDPSTRVVESRGRVEVENSVDSYVEYWRFNEDFSAFERAALISRPPMPMTEYRPIVSGKGVRASAGGSETANRN